MIATGAERILRGQIPYRDFFSELGPASFYLQAAIFKLVGVNVTTLRLTVWLLGGVMSALIYWLARRIMATFTALLAASIFFLVGYPFNYTLSHHWWANFFFLLTVVCIVVSGPRTTEFGRTGARYWLFLSGVLAALTLLSMQTKGLWVMAAGCAFLIFEPRVTSRGDWRETAGLGLRRAAWFLVGAGATLAASASYFLFHGAAAAWFVDNFLFLATNYWTYHLDIPQASAMKSLIRYGYLAFTQWSVYFNLFFVAYVFFLLAPIGALGGTAWQLFSARRSQSAEVRILLLYLLAGIGAFLSEFHSPDVYHLVWAAPPMLALLVYQWGRAISARYVLGPLARAAAVASVALMLSAAGHKAVTSWRIDAPVETRRGTVYAQRSYAKDTREVINAIQQRVPPGGETFFYPYLAELYFLTETNNPTRFDVLYPGFNSAHQMDETIACLRSVRPAYIFSFDKTQRWTFRPHFPDDPPDVVGLHPVEKALLAPDGGYHIVATIPSGYTTGFRPPGRVAEMEVFGGDSGQ